MNFERFGLYPLSVLPIQALLCNLADVNFRVEVGSKSFVVVTSIAIYDVEILYFVEVVLSSISGKDACYTWVEATAQDGAQASIFEALLVSPLP